MFQITPPVSLLLLTEFLILHLMPMEKGKWKHVIISNPGMLYVVLALSSLQRSAITNIITLVPGFPPQVCRVAVAITCSH